MLTFAMFRAAKLHDRIANTFAQVFVCWIVRESSELVLHRLREGGIRDDGILRFLVGEIRVEVCNVENGFLEAIG